MTIDKWHKRSKGYAYIYTHPQLRHAIVDRRNVTMHTPNVTYRGKVFETVGAATMYAEKHDIKQRVETGDRYYRRVDSDVALFVIILGFIPRSGSAIVAITHKRRGSKDVEVGTMTVKSFFDEKEGWEYLDKNNMDYSEAIVPNKPELEGFLGYNPNINQYEVMNVKLAQPPEPINIGNRTFTSQTVNSWSGDQSADVKFVLSKYNIGDVFKFDPKHAASDELTYYIVVTDVPQDDSESLKCSRFIYRGDSLIECASNTLMDRLVVTNYWIRVHPVYAPYNIAACVNAVKAAEDRNVYVNTELNRVASLLYDLWAATDPMSDVAQNPTKYMANFTEMARGIIKD